MSLTCFDLITPRLNGFNPGLFFFIFPLYTCLGIDVRMSIKEIVKTYSKLKEAQELK